MFCEHFGFNYLNLLNSNGKRLGRHFSSKNRARVRIGSVIGLKFPCKRYERNYAFGVGLDYNNGQVDLSSGFIKQTQEESSFKAVEVQVAFMLKDTAFENEYPYVPFGARPESNALFSSRYLQTFPIAHEQFGWSDPDTTNQPGVDFKASSYYAFHFRLSRVNDNDGDSSPLDREIFELDNEEKNLPAMYIMKNCVP